jgi:site-specific DNA recombinase
VTTKRGKAIDKGDLYKLLNNHVYLGEAVHRGTAYPGEHKPIIDWALCVPSWQPRRRPAPA